MAMGTSGTPEHEASAREQLMKQWPGQDWEVRGKSATGDDTPRTPKGKGKPSGNSNGDDERRDDS